MLQKLEEFEVCTTQYNLDYKYNMYYNYSPECLREKCWRFDNIQLFRNKTFMFTKNECI